MASPSTIRSTRSIAPSDDSSRRPTMRMTNDTKAKRTMPRRTMSMGSGQYGDRAVEGEEAGIAVEERHVGAAAPDVGRKHLELHVQPICVAGREAAEVELEPAVAARLRRRRRLDRVDAHPLEPAVVEDEAGGGDPGAGLHVEAGPEKETAADALPGVDGEPRNGGGPRR